MSCNSCAKPFSMFRKERGCPGCGFSYCSNCLFNKIFVQKLNAEAKVCAKCTRTTDSNEQKRIEPPDAYYKRLGLTSNQEGKTDDSTGGNPHDEEIQERLRKLKQDQKTLNKMTPEEEISERLKGIKQEVPSTSDAELQLRLANLRGVPISTVQSKPILPTQDLRTEQEQVDDLLKQYVDQTKIDNQYKDEFDALVNDIESRMQKLKDASKKGEREKSVKETSESEDEEETVKKIVEKIKAKSSLEENEIDPVKIDELPFCEICNEDARVRCVGCRYLFCKHCFAEHKDDDYECNRYEPYEPPKGNQY